MKNACYIAPFKMNGLNDVDDQKNITMPLRRSQLFDSTNQMYKISLLKMVLLMAKFVILLFYIISAFAHETCCEDYTFLSLYNL